MSSRIVVDPNLDDLKSPVTRKGLRYWHSRCGEHSLPSRNDIDPSQLKTILPNMCFLSVLDDGDYQFRLLGTKMRDFLSGDYTGLKLSEVEALQPADLLIENFSTCLETRKPVLANTPYVGPKKEIAELEDIILPLSEDGMTVDRLLVIVDFRFKLDADWT